MVDQGGFQLYQGDLLFGFMLVAMEARDIGATNNGNRRD
jgi:hypothetical protein